MSARPLALVTGGGRRLGRAIALALGEAGYDVAISYHQSEAGAMDTVRELERAAANAFAVRADLSDPKQCQRLMDVVTARGALALLVNNAARFERVDPEIADLDAFDRAMALNLRAPYVLSCAAGRHMRAQGRGAIVQIASLGGLRPYRHHLPYSLSKAGLIHLTRFLAIQFAPEVRVNAIAPATVEMPQEPSELPSPAADRVPLRRHATAAELTQAVLFAAHAEYLTGQILRLDGGLGIESAATDANFGAL